VPRRHRILQQEIRLRAPKCRTRLPRGLVQIRDALATQEAHPDSPRALGLSVVCWCDTLLLVGGGNQPPPKTPR